MTRAESFSGADANKLVADAFRADGPPVLLLHGGGQTRHAWRNTATALASAGWSAYAVDQRGHGDSDWIENGFYAFVDYARDVLALAAALSARHGTAPVVIGASLGGIASLLAHGIAVQRGGTSFAGIVLVDVTPRMDEGGVDKVQGFMAQNARDGFATVDDAADAVASYLPHRPRPRSHAGLRKNLRQGDDGRWRWHWDPRFLDGPRTVNHERQEAIEAMETAARALSIPALLVRGGSSEMVTETHAQAFLDLAPDAQYADVAGARHMVAGDRNDLFSKAILRFLRTLREPATK